MNTITPFNKWILDKINQYLSNKEGCYVYKSEFTQEGARTILQDSFGFQYEIQIRTIGRVQTDPGNMEKRLFYERKA